VEFADSFDWSQNPGQLLNEIYKLHAMWITRPTPITLLVDFSDELGAVPHPPPCGIPELAGLVEFWAVEVGQIRARHDRTVGRRPGCVGVACGEAWAGVQAIACPTDATGQGASPFETIGPDGVAGLEDAWSLSVRPRAAPRSQVPFNAALANIALLGGIVGPRTATSHIPIRFPGARTWVLDSNDDPVPDAYLDALKPTTGLSLPEIKSVLLHGNRPERRFRLASRYQSRSQEGPRPPVRHRALLA
jgi:hypothetical protein